MGKKEKLSAQDQAELDALNAGVSSSDQEELDALNASISKEQVQPKKVSPVPQINPPKGSGVSVMEGGTSGLGPTTSDYLTFQQGGKVQDNIPEISTPVSKKDVIGITGPTGPQGMPKAEPKAPAPKLGPTGPMGATIKGGVKGLTGAAGETGLTPEQGIKAESEKLKQEIKQQPKVAEKGVTGIVGLKGAQSLEQEQEQIKKDIEKQKKESNVSDYFDEFKVQTQNSLSADNDNEAKNFYLYYLKQSDPEEYNYQIERLEYNKDNPLEKQKIEYDFINKGLALKQRALSSKLKSYNEILSDPNLGYETDISEFKQVNSDINSLVPKIESLNSELSKYSKDENGNIIVDELNRRKVEKLIEDYKTEYGKYDELTKRRDEILDSGFGQILKKVDEIGQEEAKNYQYALNLEQTIIDSEKYPELKKELIKNISDKITNEIQYADMPEWGKAFSDVVSGFQRAGTDLIKGVLFLPKLFGEKAGYGFTDKFYEVTGNAIDDFADFTAPISPDAKKNIFDYERNPDGSAKLDANGNKIEKVNYSALPYQISNGVANLGIFMLSGGAGGLLRGSSLLSKVGLTESALSKVGTFAAGYTMAAENNYNEAKQANMSETDALTYSKYKSVLDGAIELIFPEVKLITPESRVAAAKIAAQYISKGVPLKDAVVQSTKETFKNLVGENVEELTALMSDYVTKLAAEKATGADFKIDDDLMNQIKSTVLITSIITAPFGIIGAKGKRNQIQDQSLFLAANKPEQVLKDIDDLLDAKVIDEKQAETAREKIRIASEELKTIPQDLSDDKKVGVLSKLVDKIMLEVKKKETNPAFHANIDNQIKEKDAEIEKEVNRPDNGLTVEQNDELEDLTFKKENGVITEEEQKRLDGLNKFVEEYKKPKTQVKTRTMVTVEVLPEGQRFPTVTTIPKEEFEAFKQNNPSANIVYEREVPIEEKIVEKKQITEQEKIDEINKRREKELSANKKVTGLFEGAVGGEVETSNEINARYDAEIAALKQETKKQENAIQEPITDEGVLRQEGPEMGLQKMGEGEPIVQVAAEEVKLEQPQVKKEEQVVAEPLKDVESTAKALEGKDISKEILKNTRLKSENGNPLVLYHGTDKIFDDFKKAKSERIVLMSPHEVETPAFFFHPSKDFASSFGKNIKEVNLNVKKLANENRNDLIDAIKKTWGKEGKVETANNGVIYFDEYPNDSWIDKLSDKDGIDWMLLENEKFIDNLRKKGIDGTGVWEDDNSISYAVFDANKIIQKKDSKQISEAYHKAKADGSNPELVQAVEDLLTPKKEQDEQKVAETERVGKPGEKVQGVETKTTRKRASKTRVPKSKSKIKDKRIARALERTPKDAYEIVLQAILGGVKFKTAAFQKLFGNKRDLAFGGTIGKKALSEARKRFGIWDNKKGYDIKELAEKLWMDSDMEIDDAEFRDAVEQALLDHTGVSSIIDYFENEAEIEGEKYKRLEEDAYISWFYREYGVHPDELNDYWENLSPEEQEALANENIVPDNFIPFFEEELESSEPTEKVTEAEKTTKQKAEEVNKKIDDFVANLKGKISDGNTKNRLYSAPIVTPEMINNLIDLSAAVIKKSISAGATIAQAVEDGINAIRNHPRYKRLIDAGQINEKNFEDEIRKNYEPLIKEEEAKKKEEVPPVQPPQQPTGEKKPAPEGKKERATATRILENKQYHEEVVKRLSDNAIFYDPVNVKKSEEFVSSVIDQYEADGKLDDLVGEFMKDKSDVIPDVQQLLFGDLLTKKLEDVASKEKNEFVRDTVFDMAERVFEKTAEKTTSAAQKLALIRNRDTRMFSNEIQMRRYTKRQIEKMQDNGLSDAQKQEIKDAQEIIKEFTKSDEFNRLVESATSKKLIDIAAARDGEEKTRKFNEDIDSLMVNLNDC